MNAWLAVSRAAAGALPLLLGLALWLFMRRRRRVARALGDSVVVRRLLGEDLAAAPRLRIALVLLAGLALGAALSDPRWGSPAASEAGGGGPVVLVLDVSSSMLAEDLRPNRLAVVRAAAGRLAGSLGDVPVGIVVFAGRAYALTPPTVDQGALSLYLEALDPQMVTQTGSSLAGAIRQGVGLLSTTEARSGALVLVTDGDALDDPNTVRAATQIARRAGVAIHTLGVGTPAGATIPDVDFTTGRRVGLKRRPDGGVAISRRNDEVLRDIARRTGGEYRPLASAADVDPLAAALRAGRGGGSGAGRLERPARYGWFAAAALLLLLLEGALPRLRQRRSGPGEAALAVLLLAMAACAPDEARPRTQGSAAAARRYATLLRDEPESLLLRHNLGTALLMDRRYEDARKHLEAAARARDPRLRSDALYNLGNTDLEPALGSSEGEGREEALRRAIGAYKRSLLIRPGELDAKWNLELAQRALAQQQSSGGGGGGGGGGSDPEAGRQDPQPQPAGQGGASPRMSPSAAERILSGAQQRELDTQREKLRKPQPRDPTAHE